ncbi:NnrS family protein [Hyphobacterium marinum]|uniref:NnrS family protein n=1 Tax=Hyphobacterium marinum TaxID=3116574 RepID=A0ABU7LU69_9PROT|nr:NnrS family protein [Hyphobacterium sp. Y6023]MEE2565106.1 NnrS family protein [Hyphobacterium sp. Y6023]
MTQSIDRGALRRSAPPILQNAFRPFFLGGAAWAALLVPLWAAEYLGWLGPSQGVAGHAHEMLYAVLAAIVCGFALTAIPNWTGRAPVAGQGLAALFLVWLAGRLAFLAGDATWHVLIDGSFLVVLALIVFREILSGKNWRNLPIAVLITLFAISHAAFHHPDLQAGAIRATFGVAALLIALIGGRIVPSFTRNWLAANAHPASQRMPSPMQVLDKMALGLTAVAILAWVGFPGHWANGILMIGAGTAQLVRLARWQGLTTLREPLVWSLHAGFLWLFVALVLIGSSAVWPQAVPAAAGVHALAAGLIGSMTLAVMTRASLGHTGRPRTANILTTATYLLVHAGAIIRVIAAFAYNDPIWLGAAAGLWSAAFGLFALGYAPMLISPRRA